VRCTHGATIGQLDAESLFYLQSRGIGKREARSLLTYAFAQDVVDRIKVQSLRDSLERILFEKFHEHSE
jgi:Fe-S cluster assembly protein SufD